jgi:hypothetical protein
MAYRLKTEDSDTCVTTGWGWVKVMLSTATLLFGSVMLLTVFALLRLNE